MPNDESVVQIAVSGKSLLIGTGGEGAEWTEEQRRRSCMDVPNRCVYISLIRWPTLK
jgi:hypothetical protein